MTHVQAAWSSLLSVILAFNYRAEIEERTVFEGLKNLLEEALLQWCGQVPQEILADLDPSTKGLKKLLWRSSTVPLVCLNYSSKYTKNIHFMQESWETARVTLTWNTSLIFVSRRKILLQGFDIMHHIAMAKAWNDWKLSLIHI